MTIELKNLGVGPEGCRFYIPHIQRFQVLYLRRQLGPRLHFWPFDGWTPPADRSVIAEIYPSLWGKTFQIEDRTSDQHDAYSAARWMQETDAAGKFSAYFGPSLRPLEQSLAKVEGWILGIA